MNNRLRPLLRLVCLFVVCAFARVAGAQTHARMMLWDSHERYPLINEIEFQGADSALATYDAIYGHGAMMENEWYAVRIYMDHRQSVDLYGKRTPRPELAVTRFYTTPELLAQGYGEDMLFVGESVGAGSLRGWQDNRPTYIQPVSARGQRILFDTPDSSAVEVWDRDWDYRGATVQMRQRYTMYSGSRDMTVDVWLTGCSDDMPFCTGVQKLESNASGFLDTARSLVGSWGTNVPDKGHPEQEETLGMALRTDPCYVTELREDALNYLIVLHPVDGHLRYTLTVCADMERDGGFHSFDEWRNFLLRSASAP